MNSIAGDVMAQKVQQEIKGADDEEAGGAHGEAKEIEGESDQNEIDNEIELETENESEVEQEGVSAEGSLENNSSDTTISSEGN